MYDDMRSKMHAVAVMSRRKANRMETSGAHAVCQKQERNLPVGRHDQVPAGGQDVTYAEELHMLVTKN
nr:hypothetical protein CFP56_50340 [Quercus suber]